MTGAAVRALPWRPLVAATVAGTALCVVLMLANLSSTRDTFGGLVVAQPDALAAPVLRAELGDDAVGPGGHDSAYFYVVARDPFDLDQAATGLDAPVYRLQRIGFPIAAWLLHPVGGGDGLVLAMAVVGVIAVAGLCLSTGALSATFGGSPLVAVVPGILPGAWMGLRISAGDTAALALAMAALACDGRGRTRWALGLGVAAVLTRETAVLVLLGWLLSRRDRPALRLAVVPAVVAAAWYLVLRATVPVGVNSAGTLAAPGVGLWESARQWAAGVERGGAVIVALTGVLVVVALVRGGWRHPLAGVVVTQLALLTIVAADVIGPERNASRTTLPLAVAAVVMVATPRARVAVSGLFDRSRR